MKKQATIKLLKEITEADFKTFGDDGYSSDQIFDLKITNDVNSTTINLLLTSLTKPYVKRWETEKENIDDYNKIIKTGNSFGIYNNEVLVGIAICAEQNWNNSLYIENIIISQQYRGSGFGKLLLEKIIEHAKDKNFRIIELETQNTNVPAIKFYQNQGFEITGLKSKLYSEETYEKALYMTYEINDKTTNFFR